MSFEYQENQFEGCLLCVSCKLKPSSTAALFTNLADEKESVKREILASTLKPLTVYTFHANNYLKLHDRVIPDKKLRGVSGATCIDHYHSHHLTPTT